MTMTPSSLAFLHPCLTPLIGTPTNTSLKLLTKELCANVHVIPSTCSGGSHGHLGLVMPTADYFTLTGVAFQLPAHPGDNPILLASATQFVLSKLVHVFKAELAELTLAVTLHEELKKQLLTAINHLYLAALDDNTFGFADVSVADILTHLHTAYGTITHTKLETNQASIATLWTPANPIETL